MSNPLSFFWTDTATVQRVSAATGALATATPVAGKRRPVQYQPSSGRAPYNAETFDGDVTDTFTCAHDADIHANDVLTIGGQRYRARRPRIHTGGQLPHMVVPLSAFTPGA